MAKYNTLPNTFGQVTIVKAAYSTLKNQDYVTTQLQNNVQVLTDQVNSKTEASQRTSSVVFRSSQTTFSTGQSISFQQKQTDPANIWSIGSSKFTLGSDGYYSISVSLMISTASPTSIYLVYNGDQVATVYSGTPGSSLIPISFSFQYQMSSGDILSLKAGASVTVGGSSNGFSNQFGLRW